MNEMEILKGEQILPLAAEDEAEAMGALGVGSVVTAGGYYIASRKTLR